MAKARRAIQAVSVVALLPLYLQEYFRPSTGAAYGIGRAAKLRLLLRMVRTTRRVQSASNFVSHLFMATKIMNLPPTTPGVLVECGCFKGASSANLSLVARLCGRELHVFDSFEGLPEPEDEDRSHVVLSQGEVHTYEAGAYAGALEEVRANIAQCGDIDVCHFHKGFVEDTLPGFGEPVAFAYVDVDLVSAVRTCIQYLWPLLADGSYFFTDEAHHLSVAALFFDATWWQDTLGTDAPGLVGAGSGLGIIPDSGGARSSIGYTVKNPAVLGLVERPQER